MPNPGSDEALAMGCTCPVLDNGHGAGSGHKDWNGDPLFWIMRDCKLHASEYAEVWTDAGAPAPQVKEG